MDLVVDVVNVVVGRDEVVVVEVVTIGRFVVGGTNGKIGIVGIFVV